MMSKKQWFMLLCVFIVYLLLGASLFYFIESKEEAIRSKTDKKERKIIEELLKNNYKGGNESQHRILHVLTEYCGKPLSTDMSQLENPQKWDFYHSLFFVITVVSTIGYGNLAPTTTFTRIFMIFYGLIGIPINGIVMVTLGDFFGKSFTKLHDRWKRSKHHQDSAKLGLIGQIILYLVPGFTFFIFLPSVFMTVFEGWEYDVSVYYSFVTLTTIGFGDFVAGVEDVNNFGIIWHLIYKIFLLVWIIGGLGYVVMVLGFISQGLRSKKMIKLEHVIRENIKKTPQRIRKELRTLLQEFLLLRVKPVYKGDFEYTPHYLERSQSCPDLTIYRNLNSPTMVRKRAYSECYRHIFLQRVQSESDLQRIDIERTFRPSEAFMQQNALLLKVVDALSEPQNSSQELGINCFSDEAILASEQLNRPKRRRAVSDIRPPSHHNHDIKDNQITWYGYGAAEAFNELRARNRTFSEPTTSMEKPSEGFLQKIKNKFTKTKEDKSFDIEKQAGESSIIKKPTLPFTDKQSAKKRTSLWNYSESHENHLRRASVLSAQQEAVLENTSIAELIRIFATISGTDTTELPAVPPTPITPQRTRRMPIRSNLQQIRRSSLIPSHPTSQSTLRRFSLRPVDENLLMPAAPPPYSATMQSGFPRGSLRNQQKRKFSVNLSGTSPASSAGPVQRHLNRSKDKDESLS